MTKTQLFDLDRVSSTLHNFSYALRTYQVMEDTTELRAENLTKRGVTNPLPAIIAENKKQYEKVLAEQNAVISALATLGYDAPKFIHELNLHE